MPPLTRKSDGLPTGAVSGYCNMVWKLLEDMRGGERIFASAFAALERLHITVFITHNS